MSVASVAKITARLAKLQKTSKGVAQAGKGVHKSAGSSVKSITDIVKGSVLGSAAGSFLNGNQNQSQFALPFAVDFSDRVQDARIVEDPIVDIPAIVAAVDVEETDELLPKVPEKINLTTTESVPVSAEVDPKIIVENYFNDDVKPIAIEASIPESVSFSTESPELKLLQTDVQRLNNIMSVIGIRLNTVEEAIQLAVLQNQSIARNNEKRRDEEDVERKSPPKRDQPSDQPQGRISQGADFVGAMVGAQLARYALPAVGLLGFALATEAEEALLANKDVDELAQDLETIDAVHENYVEATVGLMAAKNAGAVKTIAVGTAIAASQIKEAAPLKNLTQAVMTKSEPVTRRANAVMSSIKDIRPNPTVAKIVVGLKTMSQFLASFGKSVAGPTLSSASNILGPFFAKAGIVLKGLLAKPVKWYLIVETIMLTISMGEAYILNPSPEGEKAFHENVKLTFNRIIDMIGGTYVGAYIGVAMGASIGTAVFPVIGTVAGTLLGAIFGIMVGDTLFQILPIDSIVNASYDYFIRGDKSAFNSLGRKMQSHVMKELSKVADGLANTVDIVTGGGIEMATTEDIVAEYGNITPVQLIEQATSGLGTDENAIAFALKDIKSKVEMNAFSEVYKAETGIDLDERLQEELSVQEYVKLKQQINRQFATSTETVVVSENMVTPSDITTTNQELVTSPELTDATVRTVSKPNITTSEQLIDSLIKPQGVSGAPLTSVEEKQQFISRILNEETVEQTSVVNNTNNTSITTVVPKSIPDIAMSAAVEQKAGQGAIVPIVIPPQKSNAQYKNPLGSTSGQSQVDSARSGYDTSDSFLSNTTLQT
jgi:hypothetical protein